MYIVIYVTAAFSRCCPCCQQARCRPASTSPRSTSSWRPAQPWQLAVQCIRATVSGLPVSLTGNAVGPINSSIELDQAIATAVGFSFPTPAMDTVSPLGDLLSSLVTALDGDLSTILTGL